MSAFDLRQGPREEDVPEGTLLAGRYRAEKVLGVGGMGVVVRVRRLQDATLHAFKLLRPSVARDETATARFLREAAAAKRITSPHVVTISDVGTLDSGVPFFVMEYLDGVTLERRLAERNRLPVTVACDLALQVCVGLAAAHKTGVVHRDIKPANLFLCRGAEGGAERLKIVDFGVSKLVEPEAEDGPRLTRTKTALGSPLYMSPEQMRSARSADARTDIWSLGAVLYRAVAGCLPFDAKSLPRLCVQVLEADFVPVRERSPELPSGLATAIERCLRAERDQRFGDVAELAAAIAPFAGSEGAARAEACRAILGGGTSV
jgi:serine/threonine protein kinase